MAFMGIFLLVIILMVYVLVLAILMIVYVITFIYALLGAIISGIVWLVKKRKNKPRDVPLAFLISYGLILSVLIGIGTVEAGKTALVNSAATLVEDEKVYVDEEWDEIYETDTITLNGIKYYRFKNTDSFTLDYRNVPVEHRTHIANIRGSSSRLIYDIKNDAGVTMLACIGDIYLTAEDTEKMLEYYLNETEPHRIYIRYWYDGLEVDLDMNAESYNQLYNELCSEPKEIDYDSLIPWDFQMKAISNDKIAEREIFMSYSIRKDDIYFNIDDKFFKVNSREACDIILPDVRINAAPGLRDKASKTENFH